MEANGHSRIKRVPHFMDSLAIQYLPSDVSDLRSFSLSQTVAMWSVGVVHSWQQKLVNVTLLRFFHIMALFHDPDKKY